MGGELKHLERLIKMGLIEGSVWMGRETIVPIFETKRMIVLLLVPKYMADFRMIALINKGVNMWSFIHLPIENRNSIYCYSSNYQ